MKHGQFDDSSAALQARLEIQQRRGAFDLNQWLFGLLKPMPGEHCLDLGCGTGSQSIPLAERVGPGGRVTALDVSSESLAALVAAARERGVAERIVPLRCALDDLPAQRFDCALASYSLYYVDDARRLFCALSTQVGRLLYCGPARGNNRELRALMGDAGEETKATRFMEDATLAAAAFGSASKHRFENPITFSDPEELVRYWRNHNLFRADAEAQFRSAVGKHFTASATFTNVKRGVAVLARR